MVKSFLSKLLGSKRNEQQHKPLTEEDRQHVHDLAMRLAQATYADPYRGSTEQSDISSVVECYDALGKLVEPMRAKLSRYIGPLLMTSDFFIENLSDRYRLHGVSYDDGIITVDWSKKLLDRGYEHTQMKWVELTKDSEWKLAPAPLYHASLATLYQNRDHANAGQKGFVEKVRQMFADDFGLYWMTTGTRVTYKPQGDDVVVHGLGYGNPRTIQENVAGPNGYVTAGCGLEDCIEALLGTRDLAEVEQVYGWVSEKKPYLWRLNNKPTVNDELAVVLGVSGNGRFLVSVDVRGPARGVVVQNAAQKFSTMF